MKFKIYIIVSFLLSASPFLSPMNSPILEEDLIAAKKVIEAMPKAAVLPPRKMAEIFLQGFFPQFKATQYAQDMLDAIYRGEEISNGVVGNLIACATMDFSEKNKVYCGDNETFAGERMYEDIEFFFIQYDDDELFIPPVQVAQLATHLREIEEYFATHFSKLLQKYLYSEPQKVTLKRAEMFTMACVNIHISGLDHRILKNTFHEILRPQINDFIFANHPDSQLRSEQCKPS